MLLIVNHPSPLPLAAIAAALEAFQVALAKHSELANRARAQYRVAAAGDHVGSWGICRMSATNGTALLDKMMVHSSP